MTPERLDISAFSKAIVRLEEGVARYARNTDDDQIRDGLIQRFEFTYELSHKMLKRYLEMSSPTPHLYDALAFQELIRSGNGQGLLRGDWSVWKNYRAMRAKSSHTYDEDVAIQITEIIPDFLREARFLRDMLIARCHCAPPIDIRPDHWQIVRAILARHVPEYEVWAFGSRAQWTAKAFSDLDLAIITEQPLPLATSAALTEDFSESDLPYTVDVTDWAAAGEAFKKLLAGQKVVLQHAPGRSPHPPDARSTP